MTQGSMLTCNEWKALERQTRNKLPNTPKVYNTNPNALEIRYVMNQRSKWDQRDKTYWLSEITLETKTLIQPYKIKKTSTKWKQISNKKGTVIKISTTKLMWLRFYKEKRWVYLLVNLDTDGTFGDVPDTTGTTMVELVRHTLVDSPVNPNIDIVTDVVGSEVSGEGNGTLLPEWAREWISRARSQTMTGRHLFLLCISHSLPCSAWRCDDISRWKRSSSQNIY